MVKKGQLKQWFSRIKHGNEDPQEFSVVFRDFNNFIELEFNEFIKRSKEDNIPIHRITQIRKKSVSIFTRPGFCQKCGHPLMDKECKNKECF